MASSDLKRFMIPGALVVGGVTVGSMLAPVAFAAATDETESPSEETDTETTESLDSEADADGDADDDGEARARKGRRGHFARHLAGDVLTETLDMTAEELRAALADGQSLADVAGEQGVAIEDLKAALVEAATERIDEAVAEDRIDADRAAELTEGLSDHVDELLNRTPGEMFDGEGRGRGHSHYHRHGRNGGAELAEFLGLTTDELRSGFADGQSLADIAEAQGIDEDDLVAFLMGQLEERLDQAVENGRLDADDVEEKLADAEVRIEEHINAEPGERPGRGHRHGGFRGDRADTDGGDTDTDGETVESSLDV